MAGACISSLFIAKILQVHLPYSIILSLGLTVWIIYTLDHLMDGIYVRHAAGSMRHLFHQKYARKISFFLILALLLSGLNLFLLPERTLRLGVLLIIAVTIYFIVLQIFRARNLYLKETTIAIIYTLGLFIGPFSMISAIEYHTILPLFIQFLGLSMANLLLFSMVEKELDQKDGHASLTLTLGSGKVKYLGYFSIILVWVMGIISLIIGNPWAPQLVIAIMSGLLWAMTMNPAAFIPNEKYRLIGDGVFLLPLLLLL